MLSSPSLALFLPYPRVEIHDGVGFSRFSMFLDFLVRAKGYFGRKHGAPATAQFSVAFNFILATP